MLSVKCESPFILQSVLDMLARTNIDSAITQPVTLVIDAPWGYALRVQPLCKDTNSVIVTDNPCEEYWNDLWSCQPNVLLAGDVRFLDIKSAIIKAAKGERYKLTPYYESPLTPTERMIFNGCVRGLSNKDIAKEMALKESTVQNNLNSIYSKLNLRNRNEAMLYYYGMGHPAG